jgi:glycosyltransferase involved in cell wall biosynthesis
LLRDLPLRVLVVGSNDLVFFQALVEQLRMQDRLRFEAPSSDVLLFCAAADLYVGPSLEDSFGLPILKAMACGLPVIANAHAGPSEMIDDGETRFILADSQDHVELAHLIRRAYSDPTLRQGAGEAASQYVLANWAGMKMPKRPENSWKVLSGSHPRIDPVVIRKILRKYHPCGRFPRKYPVRTSGSNVTLSFPGLALLTLS